MDLLAKTMGRARFRATLSRLAKDHAFGSLRWEQFLDAVTVGAHRDMRWFFAEWFDRPGAPDWNFTWRSEPGAVRGVILQAPPAYRASVEVEVAGHDGRGARRSFRNV